MSRKKEPEQKPKKLRKPRGESEEEPRLVPTRRSSLAVVGDASLTAEGTRVPLEVRLAHLERRRETCPDTVELLALTRDYEAGVDAMLARRIVEHPAYPWFSRIKGCGLENTAKVVAEIEGFGRHYPVEDPKIPDYVKREPEEYQAVIEPEEYQRLVKRAEDKKDIEYSSGLKATYFQSDGRRFMHYSVGKQKPWTTEIRVGIWVAGIERLTTPSKLRKLAGRMPGMKREKGHKVLYNQTLKMLVWRLGGSLMRAEGKFYQFYLEYRNHLEKREAAKGTRIIPTPKVRMCAECGSEVDRKAARFCECGGKLTLKTEPSGVLFLGHLHNMAKGRMEQAFLDSLWAAWRTALGLPVTTPYPMAHQGHRDVIHYNDWLEK